MTSTLILGGARSGKSALGEKLALANGHACIYLATAEARDSEMEDRIQHHRERRGQNWKLIEETTDIARVISENSSASTTILIDCLTLWVSNLMERELDIETMINDLETAITSAKGDLIFIANEVGLGIVPMNKMARDFRDHAGRVNQRIAGIVDTVHFCVSGLPITLKQGGELTGGLPHTILTSGSAP
ncbi:bifunctional adenosylcobinamide kinase/adenosylcobinamide-phosphate guanylyltransferase [Kordiimonas sp. SCSIO 12610]|uniref:bifunctional adenosylcobinamide kinase/adenosylcobinamide-phosphate guanylyltransferase n=1 Tax=Kordiimonas sp. SCSIO 12610 TaxID=2829597 RepID=UPI00210966F2|nr:bifunctional adenosylcobinamide kinase/adenosylcobinamide-phosphate guanylyltransferase [Kordiimonas sp. SCSIO 12610]UTW55938.1 bifunctional adenosylcobinamide kinase/adenosylcobinamide-phosphate guanylyltransferase [Kordiimonas sp. SCSIO 12610]